MALNNNLSTTHARTHSLYTHKTTTIFVYVPFVVITIRSFPHSRPTTGFVTRVTGVTRRVPHVEQELFTLPEHKSSPTVVSGVRIARSLVFYVCFVDRCLFLLFFFFWPLSCLSFIENTASDYPFGIIMSTCSGTTQIITPSFL